MQPAVARINGRFVIENHLDTDHRQQMLRDVRAGLTSEQKALPCKYLYDEKGSRLFEQICQTEEYYPTRTELAILDRYGREVMQFFSLCGGDLVELGSGANTKIRRLLDCLPHQRLASLRYVPLDISSSALKDAAEDLLLYYPYLRIKGIIADFTRHLYLLPRRRKLITFFGSSLGNFSEDEAQKLLQGIARQMGPEDRFLLGLDMLKPPHLLETAYNDRQGITRRFILNLLGNINRKLGADFCLSDFRHRARFNPDRRRVEIHLQARRPVSVFIRDLGLRVSLARGETIHAENCRKYSQQGAGRIFARAGLEPRRWYQDHRTWFSLVELQKAGRPAQLDLAGSGRQ